MSGFPRSSLLVFVPALLVSGCRPGDDAVEPGGSVSTPEPPVTAEPTAPPGTLDAALLAHWREAGITPAPAADDAVLVRRLTLDLAGRIPTPEEVASYVDDPRPDKRTRRVDALLADEEFAAHWADVYTDLLLGGATKLPGGLEQGTHAWLEQALAADADWAEITTDLLTVSGPITSESPAGFIAVHGRQGRVEALTGATARVFLGVSIECAQCHDHPLDDRYSQRDFYELAAYFARTRPRLRKGGDMGRQITIVDRRRGQMRLPTDSDAPGTRTGPMVLPAFFGETYVDEPMQTRRDALAASIVDSPLFAKAAVGRVWTQLFGRGVVEPWNDLGAPDQPHPALLEMLAEDFRAHDHDVRHLVRTIVLSAAYDRVSADDPASPGAQTVARRRAFGQFPVRPMTVQQLVRSLLVATGRRDDTIAQRERTVDKIVKQARRAHLVEHGDDEMLSADTFTGSVPQAMFLLGGPLTVRGASATRRGTLAEILAEHEDTEARLDALMLATVGRPATRDEHERLGGYVDGQPRPRPAFEDVMHAVLLSSEFLSIH